MSRITDRSEDILDFKIDFAYEGKKEKALENVKGTISKGQCVVLCGESGCGKSTLLRCLNHLIPEFYEGVFKGCILVNVRILKRKILERLGSWFRRFFKIQGANFLPWKVRQKFLLDLKTKESAMKP